MSDDEFETYWEDILRGGIPRGRGKRLDLKGRVFGRLTVKASLGRNARKEALWSCDCQCGGAKQTTTDDLVRGRVRSCGCLARESRHRVRS